MNIVHVIHKSLFHKCDYLSKIVIDAKSRIKIISQKKTYYIQLEHIMEQNPHIHRDIFLNQIRMSKLEWEKMHRKIGDIGTRHYN